MTVVLRVVAASCVVGMGVCLWLLVRDALRRPAVDREQEVGRRLRRGLPIEAQDVETASRVLQRLRLVVATSTLAVVSQLCFQLLEPARYLGPSGRVGLALVGFGWLGILTLATRMRLAARRQGIRPASWR